MILVTGGTGLVGSHLLFELVKNNQNIRAIYRNKEKLESVKKVFSYFSDEVTILFNKIEWVEADILNIPQLTEAFKGITKVYHCAAFISFDPKDYHTLRKTNIEGTANIVNLSLANSIEKLCYVSSIATLGNKEDASLIDEEIFWNPEADNSVYSITKNGAEMEVWRGTQEGLDAVIINPGIILGAGFWHAGSGLLFKKVYNKLPYYVTGTTGYVDVIDVVQCMLLLMKSNIVNQRFVVVAKNLSFKQCTEIIAKYLNIESPKKQATSLMLAIGWRADWLKSLLTGKPRMFTKQNATSALTITDYNNQKITKALNYNFTPIEKTIERVANQFLKEQ
ncbi:NAD-dependent epimerase/dehydratase family protein [Lacinutrix sp. C3R15]|uniref:NAD-dependent epimerase/dehydratase family protein n=1 Tax=Flavobacteriaceae TaxID=49546 RepID=UPI001C08BDD8|nr:MULTISPECIES: NAD-dependent epimerase/dehydratase family protein [Flavobacteriaceae]MBU2939049.1 NAD-dependent epimerase/dehydratase family protein [Lacinutrix sp. C3R15]MDO6622364.1 NAD-dependent epimerase/dehydratase family protein [Oceanihabitans sp. 1_MG-2023]